MLLYMLRGKQQFLIGVYQCRLTRRFGRTGSGGSSRALRRVAHKRAAVGSDRERQLLGMLRTYRYFLVVYFNRR